MLQTFDDFATTGENDLESLHDIAILTGALPLFLVGWQELDDGKLNTRYCILTSVARVCGLLKKQSETDGIIELQLCSPPNLNGTERWHLEPLASVTVSVGESSGTQYFSYKTVAGTVYADEPPEQCSKPLIILTKHAFNYGLVI